MTKLSTTTKATPKRVRAKVQKVHPTHEMFYFGPLAVANVGAVLTAGVQLGLVAAVVMAFSLPVINRAVLWACGVCGKT